MKAGFPGHRADQDGFRDGNIELGKTIAVTMPRIKDFM
jgi:hypothetical protein